MQKFLLTWFKDKFLGERELLTGFFLRALGRNEFFLGVRTKEERDSRPKDAAPVPHASLASRVSWPYKGRRVAVGSCRPAPG